MTLIDGKATAAAIKQEIAEGLCRVWIYFFTDSFRE